MSDLYESGEYGRRNPGWHDEDAQHKAAAVSSMLLRAGLRPASVIDVGCGSGGVLFALQDHLGEGVQLDGWDVAPAAIALANPRGGANLQFHVGDALTQARPAELVLALDVFEHLPDDLGFLTSLRPLGTEFVFRVPLEHSRWDALRSQRRAERREQWGHLHAYDRRAALELLGRAGYEVLDEAYDRVPPAITGLSGRALDRVRRGWFRVSPHAAVAWLGGFSMLILARAK